MNYPNDLKYTNDHEWLRVEGNIGIVGITDHAQGELGDVVWVDIPEDVVTVAAGQEFGTIEAVKTVADLLAPVGGKIIEINHLLNSQPEIVNRDCYGDGWMVKIEIADMSEVDALMDVNAYKSLIGE